MIDICKFWSNEERLVKIKDMPGAMCNGFLIDLRAELVLDRKPFRQYDNFSVNLTNKNALLTLLSEGRTSEFGCSGLYIYDFETEDKRHVYLQKPYAEYFRRRYDGCLFYTDEFGQYVAVRLGNEIVGAVASVDSKRANYHVTKPFSTLSLI